MTIRENDGVLCDLRMALGIVLLWGPKGVRFLTSEACIRGFVYWQRQGTRLENVEGLS